MRLKQIKLAGFKSFVDPTKIPFEQQMTAIVGPNGCGKSNIIDAVRWVLGESSAKNLRGDSMTDVIFNGAASRKPVGQASVELIFDNTQGRLQGSMADRSEVSIRRVVNRDSTNTYFLNNAKCRRKDITDIFLGTGLGPRSYAIIEQGTISRLIESKPQELRIFIEEAAGISKYKERRRDTETRIRHTRENLVRLSDIRSELTLQVDKLHQQAEAAKRFRTLKTKERQYKAELAVLRWQQYTDKSKQFFQTVEQLQADVNALVLQQKQQDIELFQIKQQGTINDESLDVLQQNKLTLTNNIARTEQNIKHAKQLNVTWRNELLSVNAQQNNINEQVKEALEQQLSVNDWVEQEQENLLLIEEQITQAQDALAQTQQLQQQWQLRWDEYNQSQTKALQQRSVLENNISTLAQQIADKQNRADALEQSLTALKHDSTAINSEISRELLQQTQNKLIQEQKILSQVNEQVYLVNDELTTLQQQLAKQQGLQQALQVNLAQLTAQQTQQPDWANKQKQLLEQHNINVTGLLHQTLKSDKKWQGAIEQVLSFWLQAQVVDINDHTLAKHFSDILPELLPQLEQCFLVIPNQIEKVTKQQGTLATTIDGEHVFIAWLNQIHLAENIEQAQNILVNLATNESVICPDGTWLGHGFLTKGAVDQNSGYLARGHNINALNMQLATLDDELLVLQKKIGLLNSNLEKLKTQKNALISAVDSYKKQNQQLEQELALASQKQQQIAQQVSSFKQQLEQLKKQCAEDTLKLTGYNDEFALLNTKEVTVELADDLVAEKENLHQQINSSQGQTQRLHSERHQCALTLEQAKHQKTQTELSIRKNKEQLTKVKDKITELSEQLEQNMAPLIDDEQNLQQWLAQMSDVDKKLGDINQGQSGNDSAIKKIELQKHVTQQKLEQAKEHISKNQLEGESFKLRAEAAKEQLTDLQQTLSTVLANMPDNAKEGVWQAQIVRLARELNNLGAINLAAIDEYESQLERKLYLDQQDEDLTQAINTLESAIAKIDKESRQKFQVTFDQVNNDLKILFPKVFGGGSAYLALTGDDLLDTGVTIMARPPGKKNSTIHLLSGGEKALTALSLVFAIFRLNPAPFCMLDEVDAPLDDANVERFCNLVREMSETVQFIYISHNKIAMEMASHLTGVTMFEPGVSRMVAVDIDEALAMAELS
jgi:chromosome segregation protein